MIAQFFLRHGVDVMSMVCLLDGGDQRHSAAVQFVLDCVTLIPLAIGHFVIKKVCKLASVVSILVR